MSEKHRESQPRAIALPRGKHGKFELGQLYNFSGDIDENIGNKDAVVNHRRQHLRHYGHQRGSSAPVAQSLPPAAPVIGSLPPPKMTVDDMPDLSLPPQSPEAGSIFAAREEARQQKQGPIAASAPARSIMHEVKQRSSSLHENDVTEDQLSSSPTVFSMMKSMKSQSQNASGTASTSAERSFHIDALSGSRKEDSNVPTSLQGLSIEEEPRNNLQFDIPDDKSSDSDGEEELMFNAD